VQPLQESNPPRYVPKSRGYHASVLVTLDDGHDVMLVWGGLHDSVPIGCLEIYDLTTGLWRLGELLFAFYIHHSFI